jgi:Tfp pilus assembly protein FimT
MSEGTTIPLEVILAIVIVAVIALIVLGRPVFSHWADAEP